MSNRSTEPEIDGLNSLSRDNAGRGNYAEANRLVRDLPLKSGDWRLAMILQASLAMRLEQYEFEGRSCLPPGRLAIWT
jgi:hypothetical protein